MQPSSCRLIVVESDMAISPLDLVIASELLVHRQVFVNGITLNYKHFRSCCPWDPTIAVAWTL